MALRFVAIHLGGLRIGDRVEIGSLNTVCQGTLGPTITDDDVKTDDQVHIAQLPNQTQDHHHRGVVLAGGVTVGEEAWLGPNSTALAWASYRRPGICRARGCDHSRYRPGATVVGNPAPST